MPTHKQFSKSIGNPFSTLNYKKGAGQACLSKNMPDVPGPKGAEFYSTGGKGEPRDEPQKMCSACGLRLNC